MLVFKILTQDQFEYLKDSEMEWQGSDHDKRDGFIHLCTEFQALGVVQRYFNCDIVYLAQVSTDKEIKWERAPTGIYPHLYSTLTFKNFTWIQKIEQPFEKNWPVEFKQVATNQEYVDLCTRCFEAPKQVFIDHGATEQIRFGVYRQQQLVSGVRILKRTLKPDISCGAIADVCTLSEYQKRGYSSHCLTQAHEWMVEQKCAVGLLHSSKNASFYLRFGYLPWPMSYSKINLKVNSSGKSQKCKLDEFTGSCGYFVKDANYYRDWYSTTDPRVKLGFWKCDNVFIVCKLMNNVIYISDVLNYEQDAFTHILMDAASEWGLKEVECIYPTHQIPLKGSSWLDQGWMIRLNFSIEYSGTMIQTTEQLVQHLPTDWFLSFCDKF